MHENLCSASQIHDTIHMACCELQLRRIQKSCIGVGADLASLCLCYFAEADVSHPCSSGG